MGEIWRTGSRGHGTVAKWDPKIPAEVKTAEQVFDLQLDEGRKLWDISDPDAARTEDKQMTKFDPNATVILSHAAPEGG